MALDEIELSEDLSLTALTLLNEPFLFSFYTQYFLNKVTFYSNIAMHCSTYD